MPKFSRKHVLHEWSSTQFDKFHHGHCHEYHCLKSISLPVSFFRASPCISYYIESTPKLVIYDVRGVSFSLPHSKARLCLLRYMYTVSPCAFFSAALISIYKHSLVDSFQVVVNVYLNYRIGLVFVFSLAIIDLYVTLWRPEITV